ncbi:MAG: MFS transporter [Alphaproteobacteria bacterium]|uniref:MFS transporter n=1 Tax=Brevundimonas sp. TaxID=1871086 RepID=UPI0018289666|nr:MFS transporter [Brevundimonas sp.]MBA3050886.1 MFS transporter [Brevundimonas sp.]MBU3975130.1 MFS transporter [Alphaproteobacteria bacterium]
MALQQTPAFDEAAASAARSVPLTARFKAAYGAGAMADGIVAAGFGFFLLFYLTAVCGMSGTMAGTAKLIALLIDAVADPAIGLASDRLRSRFGRRLPFMVGGLLPFAVAFGLLFSVPASLTGAAQFIYVTVCLVVLRLSLSFFVLPFTAAGAEVTDDYRERGSIVAFRLSFQNAGILLGVVLGLGVFMAGADGMLSRGAYVPFAWTCAAVMLLAGMIAIRAVRSAQPRLHGPETGGGHFLAGFGREMIELSRNRSFLILFGTVLTYFLAYSAHVSLALHASRYFWGLDTGAIQLILLSTTLGPLLGAPISAFALRHIEKRTLSVIAFLAIALFLMWPPLLQLYGPAPLTPAVATVVLFVNGLLVGTSIMIGGIGFQSMLADTADEHEWLFGVRREGLFFSGLTLAFKAASGLGGLIAGIALDVIHFPTDLASRAPGQPIPVEVLDKLALISGPLPALFAMVSPLFLLGYHLTRKRHAQIIADLEARNAAKARAGVGGTVSPE